MKKEKWEVIDYDVWGNAKEGFEINDMFRTGTYVMISEDMTDEKIIEALRRQGVLKKGIRSSSIRVDAHEDDIWIEDARNGRPEFGLRKVSR